MRKLLIMLNAVLRLSFSGTLNSPSRLFSAGVTRGGAVIVTESALQLDIGDSRYYLRDCRARGRGVEIMPMLLTFYHGIQPGGDNL